MIPKESSYPRDRQVDFIGIISHEMKTPISAAIFQSENIMKELSVKSISQRKLKNEVKILSKQLTHTQELLSKLFSVHYYDTRDVQLTRESIDIILFLRQKIQLFSKLHPSILVHTDLDNHIGNVLLDEIQFEQVITNILENAVRFLYEKDPIIAISLKRIEKDIELVIEDNGC